MPLASIIYKHICANMHVYMNIWAAGGGESHLPAVGGGSQHVSEHVRILHGLAATLAEVGHHWVDGVSCESEGV